MGATRSNIVQDRPDLQAANSNNVPDLRKPRRANSVPSRDRKEKQMKRATIIMLLAALLLLVIAATALADDGAASSSAGLLTIGGAKLIK